MAANLTKRDHEILRTLVRVQLATTRSIQQAFFRNIGLARKRLSLLRGAGLVITHSKGLPGNHQACGSQYWRITDGGLRAFAKEFPNERIPDNLIARTQRASLRFFEHRDNMTDMYLRLIASQDQHIDELRSRGDIVDWRGEYEAVLSYQTVEAGRFVDRKLIPDGTLTTGHTRYFVEVDRSTESRKRIRRVLQAYDSAVQELSYRKEFPDGLPVCVVYATKSASRAKSLQKVIDSLGELSIRAHVMAFDAAAEWLAEAVSAEPPLPREGAGTDAPCATCQEHLRSLYNESRNLIAECEARGKTGGFSPVFLEVFEYLQSKQRVA